MELIRRTRNPWLGRYAAAVALSTFLLIIAGALVTSNDAGLSVPDWPTSFGSFRMPRMVGGVKFEHGHRMIAGAVGILTILLALWLWRSDERRWVRRLGGLAVLTIIAQAVLGGITVLFFLPAPISVAHACLAQICVCIAVVLALATRYEWRAGARIEDAGSPTLRQLAAGTTAAIFLQLALGAAFRHNGFGIIPHLAGAFVVTAGILWMLVRVLTRHRAQPRLVRGAGALAALLGVQVLLGIGSYIEKLAERNAQQPLPPAVTVTTAHVAIGALLLASSLLVTLEVYRTLAGPGAAPGGAIQVAEARKPRDEFARAGHF